MRVTEIITTYRRSRNMTQADLGRKLGFTTGQYIYNCESGRALPSVAIAKRICKILKIPEKKMRDAIILAFRQKYESKWE